MNMKSYLIWLEGDAENQESMSAPSLIAAVEEYAKACRLQYVRSGGHRGRVTLAVCVRPMVMGGEVATVDVVVDWMPVAMGTVRS